MRNWIIAALVSTLLPLGAGCGGGGGGGTADTVTALTITTSALAGGTQGASYSATLAATGGTPPYSWRITVDSLPGGLALDAGTGRISGFPTTAGTFAFTVRCGDAAAGSATKRLSITIAAVSGGGGGGGGGTFTWTKLTPTGTAPAGRSSHGAIVDPVGQRMIITLGSTGQTNVHTDTVALSLSSGTEAWSTLAAGPAGRWGHSTVYDSTRNRLLLFGGNVSGFKTGNDLWQYTLTPGTPQAWSQLSPGGTAIPVRVAHGAVYDPINDRMIVYGGGFNTPSSFNPSNNVRNDLWALAFSGSGAGTWSQLTPSGTAPAGRLGSVFVYDADDQRIIMFGGDTPAGGLGDVWALDISTPGSEAWTKITTAGPAPSARRYSAGAYDPIRDSLVIFGGENGFNTGDVWELALTQGSEAWTAVSPAGAGPAARDSHTAAYDAINRRIIFYGGFTMFPSTAFTDAWALSLP